MRGKKNEQEKKCKVVNIGELPDLLRHIKPQTATIRKGKKCYKYLKLYCGFDIETTTYNNNGFMYIWQFSVKCDDLQLVVIGRTWSEWLKLLQILTTRFGLREQVRVIIWVANLSYEFQFIRKRLPVDEIFAKTNRNPLYFRSGGLEFRDSLAISQGGLEYLAKSWTNTQKLNGDLDYSIIRNSKTPLTAKELQYCINDVVILSEFSEKIFADYIEKEKYIPLTSTGILRHDLKNHASKCDNINRINAWIYNLFPHTKSDYLYIMQYLFRGGFVHADYTCIGDIIENMQSYDLKSSYPASAFHGYYPISPFQKVSREILLQIEYEEYNKEYCTIAIIRFTNIEATTNHSIESKSKCINLVNPLLDNGRVRKADSMTVFITELDFATYKEFYHWENMEVLSLEISTRGELPKYLLDRFYYWFDVKNSIDATKNPQEYAISKTRINGHFGLCVTRLVFNDICYVNDKWNTQEITKSYDDMINKEVLSPYWGIYITAHSRRIELSLLYKMRSEVKYSDTDSHKLLETENVLKVISNFNDSIMAKNRTVCEKYGYDINVLLKIGTLEKETAENEKGTILRFKTLGAKIYISEYKNKGFESTISGLGKKTLKNYCEANEIDCFEAFENNMKVPHEFTGKLTPIYNDEPVAETITDAYGNTEILTELSNVYLKPVDFTLKMDKDYLALITFWKERIERNGY